MGAPKRDYPDVVVQSAIKLYAEGKTIQEVDALIGPGLKAQRLIERFVDVRRPAAPRDQTGERGPSWKGYEAGYQAFHLRVAAARGKPGRCSACDTTDPALKYEWANLTGHLADPSDYVRLCVPCHRRTDGRLRARFGTLTPLSARRRSRA